MSMNSFSIFNEIVNTSVNASADVAYLISRLSSMQENVSISGADNVEEKDDLSSTLLQFVCLVDYGAEDEEEYARGTKCGSESAINSSDEEWSKSVCWSESFVLAVVNSEGKSSPYNNGIYVYDPSSHSAVCFNSFDGKRRRIVFVSNQNMWRFELWDGEKWIYDNQGNDYSQIFIESSSDKIKDVSGKQEWKNPITLENESVTITVVY